MYNTLRLILGDQLNAAHSWWEKVDSNVLFVFMEIKPESEYVTHHIQKIVGIFQAMRVFSEEMSERGHNVKYFRINDEDNHHSFHDNLQTLCHTYPITRIEYQEPDEYRLDILLSQQLPALGKEIRCCSTEHFYTHRLELSEMFSGKKAFLMESFYRAMRKKHQVLMDGDKPIFGQWNYDKENRKKLPSDHKPPQPKLFSHDVISILEDIEKAGIHHIGKIDALHFIWPKNRSESMQMLGYFVNELMDNFGTYQDAMSVDFWSLYHSRISFALNLKLIGPEVVVSTVEKEWRNRGQSQQMLHQVEGFIRQILGWREYMRGIYWAHMPKFSELNYFEHKRSLPEFYWTGDTRMNCMSRSIQQSLDYAYAHHIQRLMITGNFALLAGIHPDELDQWYLGIYIDAFEWVEITNTRGMSQYADGGIVGTKPYVSSASYIHKMGDYCKGCHYNHTKKTGEKACPFNSLYWHFINRHSTLLSTNPRMTMMYKLWDKMSEKEEILKQANYYLDHIESL